MTSLHALAIPPLIRGMRNLSALIEKAQASDIDDTALLTSRIHPTMLPFTYQIKFVSDVATRIPHDINPSLPVSPLEPFEADTLTFDYMLARIAAAIEFLESIAPEDLNGREDAVVKLRIDRRAWANDFAYVEYDRVVDFLMLHAHPYFWFHVTTAYDLLRAGGLPLGKIDFLNAAGLKKWEFKSE